MKSYYVTIQITPLQQYFHMVLFILYFVKWNLEFVLNFKFRNSETMLRNILIEKFFCVWIKRASNKTLERAR